MKSEQIKQITSKAIEELVSALNSGRSEALTNYLAAMADSTLQFFQRDANRASLSHATHVAGYQTWKSLGRYVKKGEKGIMILPLFFVAARTKTTRRKMPRWIATIPVHCQASVLFMFSTRA